MLKIFYFIFCFILTINFGYAQSIKRSVINSFGSSSSNGTIYLSETFGQPSNIGTVSDGNTFIRQGFEQPVNNLISIPGCTDPLAFNYDINANTDDGSCIAVSLGCTDPNANNYNPFANIDNETCLYSSYIFGDSLTQFGNDVIKTNDQNFLIAGYNDNGENRDGFLAKINFNNEILWSKNIGGYNSDQFNSIIDDNGYYYMCGSTRSFSSDTVRDVFVVKTDYNGNIIWSKVFGGEGCAGPYCGDAGVKIIKESENQYVVVGNAASVGNNLIDAYIFKFNNNGELLYENTSDSGIGSNFYKFISKSSDGGLLLGGQNKAANSWEPWVKKVDSNGNLIFTKTYGDASSIGNTAVDLLEKNDSSFLLITNADGTDGLIKIDAFGDTIFNKQFTGIGCIEISFSLDSNSIYILGNYQSDINYLLKIDLEGNLLENSFFENLNSKKIITVENDLFVLSNPTFNTNGMSDISILKVDSNFNNCFSVDVDNFNYQDYEVQITNKNDFYTDNNSQNSIVISDNVSNTLNSCISCIKSDFEYLVNNETIELTNYSTPNISYVWKINDDIFSNEYNSSYEFNMNGIFDICLTSFDSCSSVTYCQTIDLNNCEFSDTSYTEVTACESYEWNGQTYTESGTYFYPEAQNPQTIDGFSFMGQLDNSYYYISENPNDWNDASAACIAAGGLLVSINSEEENNFIGTNLTNNSIWIGLYQASDNSAWQLTDGSDPTYFNWRSDQPAGFNQNCVDFYYDASVAGSVFENQYNVWTDGNCNDNYYYILEIPSNELTTINGCDSVAVIDLTINENNFGIDTQSACDSYTWIDGNTYTSSNNTATFTLTNVAGCDSVVTLDLAINNSTTSIDDVTTCESYEWNGQTYTESGEYSNTFTNINGCDSIHTLHLTINHPDTSYFEVTACESYQWNGETYTESGTYENLEQNDNEYSMSFDGVDDYINSDLNSTLFLQDATWMLWCYFSDINLQNGIIAQNNGYNTDGYYINTSNVPGSQSIPQTSIYLSTAIGNTNQLAQTWTNVNSITANQWHHIAVSLSNGVASIYIDGIYNVAGNNFNHLIQNSNSDLLIGCGTNIVGSFAQAMNGKIEDLSVWNISLTQQQIQNFMNCPPSGNESGLVGYWNFEEGEGETVIDLSGNGNDGTINGASFSTDVPEQSCQLTTINGCDSVAVLNLTITQPDTSYTEVTACESYEWNGETYTESGTYENLEQNDNEYSMSFDGVDDYIFINHNESLSFGNESISYEMWFRKPLVSHFSQTNLVTNYITPTVPLFGLYIGGVGEGDYEGKLGLHYRTVQNQSEITCKSISRVDDNLWHHVVGVKNTSTDSVYLFVDGLLVNQSYILSGNNDTYQGLVIGGHHLNRYMDVEIDELRIWNRALSIHEIQQYMNCPPTGNEEGLVGYWNFEEGQGDTVYDLSGNENHGIINGTTFSTDVPEQSCQLTTVNGCDSVAVLNLTITQPDTSYTEVTACESFEWNGQTYTESGIYTQSISSNNEFSMSFDGSNYVSISDNPSLNWGYNNFSVSAWVNKNNSSPWLQSIVTKHESTSGDYVGWNLGLVYNQIRFIPGSGTVNGSWVNNGSINSNFTLNDNQWYYITGVFDGTNSQTHLYVDGILIASEVANYSINPNNSQDLKIGVAVPNGAPSGPEYFYGNIDNIYIWSTALSQSEIQQYMNCPPTGNEEGLVGYWNFEEGEGNTVFDLSGNGNDGTINGATYSTDVPEQSCQLSTVNGCDSIAVLNLTITQPDTSFTEVTACESYEWNGETYTESGEYTNTYTNANGCDSTHTLNLTINSTTFGTDTQVHCDTYTWIDGNTYTESNNTATFTLTNSNNCDSIVTLDLIINNSNNTSSSVTACDEFTWDGQTYTESGEYTNTYTNANGCDSVAVLNLTIIQPDTSFTEVTACDEFTWDGQTYTESGEYTNTYININGCDSIHTLNLTLNSSTVNIDTQIHCNDYTWIDGVTYNESNNSATYLLTDQYGCDSIVSLDLIISYSGGSIFVNACDSYEWNGETYTESGTYINSYLSNNGCISNDTLQLNIDICGCTDEEADNFDSNATFEDGSCIYCNSFSVLLISVNDVSEIGGNNGQVIASGQGGSSNYSYNLYNSEGIPQNPFTLYAGTYTIEVIDYETFCIAYLDVEVNEPTLNFECTADGCIESSESENSFSSLDECELECSFIDPCDITPAGLYVDNVIHNRIRFNWTQPEVSPSHYMIRYREVGTNNWTVIAAGPQTPSPFNGTSRTRYFMEPETTYEWNIRARVLNEDLTINCQSDWSETSTYTTLTACANLENLSVSTEATWVTFFADAPDESWGVWQSKGKIREVGLNNYRYVNGDNIGNINGLKGNFTANTDYEWHTKAWCTGNVDENGNSDPQYHSGWGEFSAFTTEELCDKLPINLSTSTNSANTSVIMSWDSPLSGNPDHYFLELTNNTSGAVYQWNNIPGADNSKTKFNQSPGDEISWRIRGACGTNGTSWATIFTQPTVYTLGGEKLQSLSLKSLEIYPNPSRDVFNIELSTENTQQIEIRVVNSIGQEIYRERLEVEGVYTEQIDLSDYSKGIYNLTIKTNTETSNHRLILQ